MGQKTKIDWCDSTWNPVTGCLHGCEYCYARRIAERFEPYEIYDPEMALQRHAIANKQLIGLGAPYVLDFPWEQRNKNGTIQNAPYPFGFVPTFHRYKLDEPQKWKKPRNIFVCSMADLFGDWVPDEWITDVFRSCDAAPQHRYMFLTKNPKRYAELRAKGIQPPANSWIGTSVTTDAEAKEQTFALSECWNVNANWFVSVEPLLEPMSSEALEDLGAMQWVIIGAETGNSKNKVIPERKWVDEIVDACAKVGTPLFMKDSLRELMGDDFKQKFPWEV